ncbi:MAG: response regulator [Candidatus Kapabacteria bacterium]|jgi:CheY-like chemotaxis protein|nr:response regulator [Candidatus Kapabacteria bacterium]
MKENTSKILWIDDEIELLKPHIILLKQRSYDVDTASNGEDAIELYRRNHYDLTFLDESMIGISGLETLPFLKDIDPSTPVVMVTKNEAESVMEEAIGKKIDDYLTKPVNPAQILAACKKFLDSKRIKAEKLTQDYLQGFAEISRKIMTETDTWDEWSEIYVQLVKWSMELDRNPDLGFNDTLADQFKTCNAEFSKFFEKHYHNWIHNEADPHAPTFSNKIVEKFVLPKMKNNKPTVFFVIDGMRVDQWMVIEEVLRPYFNFKKDYYSSILPTATPFARNAIFAGLFPDDIQKHYPQWWMDDINSEDHKANAYERELLQEQLNRKRVKLNNNLNYIKIHETEFGRRIENNILNYAKADLTAIVINAIDIMAHSRSDFAILKEIAPDESAYRSLTKSWFLHSSFFGMLKALADKDVNIVITTDHGTIRCMHGVKVLGDKATSTCLRYKFGRNVKADKRHAMQIKDPRNYRLPAKGITVNNVIAKEDYYFVYPTDYHHYLQRYKDSFQHGGISMEETIIPVITLESKA